MQLLLQPRCHGVELKGQVVMLCSPTQHYFLCILVAKMMPKLCFLTVTLRCTALCVGFTASRRLNIWVSIYMCNMIHAVFHFILYTHQKQQMWFTSYLFRIALNWLRQRELQAGAPSFPVGTCQRTRQRSIRSRPCTNTTLRLPLCFSICLLALPAVG